MPTKLPQPPPKNDIPATPKQSVTSALMDGMHQLSKQADTRSTMGSPANKKHSSIQPDNQHDGNPDSDMRETSDGDVEMEKEPSPEPAPNITPPGKPPKLPQDSHDTNTLSTELDAMEVDTQVTLSKHNTDNNVAQPTPQKASLIPMRREPSLLRESQYLKPSDSVGFWRSQYSMLHRRVPPLLSLSRP